MIGTSPARLVFHQTFRFATVAGSRTFTSSMRAAITAGSTMHVNGDLNNTAVLRKTVELAPDPAYASRSLAIPRTEDDARLRVEYRPFLLDEKIAENDWVARLELSTVLKMVEKDLHATGSDRLKVLVLYGSMRAR